MPESEREEPHSTRDPQAVEARRMFSAMIARPDARIDVAEACLWIAAEEHPGLDVAAYLARLDELATRVRRRFELAKAHRSNADIDELALEALHTVLFIDEGFRGAIGDEYQQPRSSFMYDVLDRRRGLPILLSIVYCAVATRAGMDAVGIGLPGHFIAEFRGNGMHVLVDPYNLGRRLTHSECEELVRVTTGRKAPLLSQHVQAQPPRAIIFRVLSNLKNAYMRQRAHAKALDVVERILRLSPSAEQFRDRGLLLRQVPMPRAVNLTAAWLDLSLYARVMPEAPDASRVTEIADGIWKQLGRMN